MNNVHPANATRNDDRETNYAAPKQGRKTKSKASEKWTRWCDDSVAKMFALRYKSPLEQRFNSKNNADKKVAYVMLAAELSLAMNREFSVVQVQDKFQKMKAAWSLSKPSNPSPTGNDCKPPLPANFEIMQEYWGSKAGYRRESLMSTDDSNDDELASKHDVVPNKKRLLDDLIESELSDDEKHPDNQKPSKQKKQSNRTKTKTQGKSLEAGFNAIKDGLIFLGSSLATVNNQASNSNVATMDDVLKAINDQSQTMAKLLEHLIRDIARREQDKE
ncbi:hypothetical protein AC1031_008611 [Aphanomyces cochlioides]|nr:hypothetical protein AC1031_008611 [Aphanomyces cochlioides]